MHQNAVHTIEETLEKYITNRAKKPLLQFTNFLNVAPKVVDIAKKYFPEAQFVMDVYQDTEIDDEHLVLYVRLKHYDNSVIERLRKARAEFRSYLANKKGWIHLTTDFQKPEE